MSMIVKKRICLTILIVFMLAIESITLAQSDGQTRKEEVAGVEAQGTQDITNQPVSLSSLPSPLYAKYVDPSNGVTAEALVSVGLQQNRDLFAARQNLAIIRGRLAQAGLRPNPTIDTEYTTDRIGTREGENEFSIAYVQPIELGGRRGKRMRVAQLELAQAEKELEFQERQVTAEIEMQYAEAIAATEALRLTEQLLALNQETFRVTNIRFNEGDVARLDVNLVQVEVNRLRAQQVQSETRVRTALLQLKTLAGLGIREPLRLRSALRALRRDDTFNLEALETAALQNRADLRAARLGEEVAEARVQLAKAEASPELTVFGRYQQDKGVIDDTPVGVLVDNDKLVSFGASISLPISNRNQGAIAEAVAAVMQARHRREFLETLVRRDVGVALTRLEAAREALSLYETELLPRNQENLRIIRAAYDLGEQKLLDVVAEQRRLVETQQQYIDSLRDYYTAIIELERAVGMRIR